MPYSDVLCLKAKGAGLMTYALQGPMTYALQGPMTYALQSAACGLGYARSTC